VQVFPYTGKEARGGEFRGNIDASAGIIDVRFWRGRPLE
jgi:hypothetical protein